MQVELLLHSGRPDRENTSKDKSKDKSKGELR
jgi:hypothetical protein